MRKVLLALAMVCAAAGVIAQSSGGDEAAIRAVMTAQVDAWNKGDVSAFMQGYENSPKTTFVGTKVNKGYEPILKRYQTNYTTPAQMGKLTFSNLEVQLLPSACGATEYAVVTGNFHLERTEKGPAAKDDGIFSLVWRKGRNGWRIVLDHSS
ncbi:MAG TPA: SgcJ/EcaC family oxidoreductase [Terracidiphilus sp.]|nr:SgcJ/EcaC family oxidoreductase [Terracidiphilus sp.]